VGIALLFPVASTPSHDTLAGVLSLWNPFVLLSLQVLWILIFIYTGRSRVTAATLSFKVLKENI
jgi:hypothetical protein